MALENLTPSNRLEEILDGGDVTPSNRKEYFIQKAMSAGGSGLPAYTSADKGKVLTIGEGEGSVTTVIVPEQTVTVSSEAVSILSVGTLHNGDRCTLIVNGDVYEAIAEPQMPTSEIGIKILDGNNMVLYQVSASRFYAQNAGTYTISLTASVPSVEPKWEAARIFKVTSDSQTGVLDKSYKNITDAIAEGLLPVVFSSQAGASISAPICMSAVISATYTVFAVTVQSGAVAIMKWTAMLPTAPLALTP